MITHHRPARFLFDSEIEEIVMRSAGGQKALGMGIGSAILGQAFHDLKKLKTRKRVDDWLEALDDRWFQARLQERTRRQARLIAARKTSDKSEIAKAGLSLLEAPDRKERDLLERHGEREPADV